MNRGKTDDQSVKDIAEILRRVDCLPETDDRTPEEIIGYDENGLPASSATVSHSPQRESTERDHELQQSFVRDIPAAVKFFLEHRHREWELENERSGTERDPEAQ
jgi:hypothetical protein